MRPPAGIGSLRTLPKGCYQQPPQLAAAAVACAAVLLLCTPQGRFSFYMTSAGEEATIVGSAAALDPKDMVRHTQELGPIALPDTPVGKQTVTHWLAFTCQSTAGGRHARRLMVDAVMKAAPARPPCVAMVVVTPAWMHALTTPSRSVPGCLCLQVFSQYREQGVLLWRGFSFRDFADQVRAP